MLFHVLPLWRHRLRVVRVDEARRVLATRERGGPIRSWDHRIRIEPLTAGRRRYTDEVLLQAGSLTPGLWLYASAFCRYRQSRLRRLACRRRL